MAALFSKLAKEQGIVYPLQTFSIGLEGSPDLIAARKVRLMSFVCAYTRRIHHEDNTYDG